MGSWTRLGPCLPDRGRLQGSKKFDVNHASEKLPATEGAWDVMRGLSGCKRPKPPLTRSWPEIPRCDLSIIVPCYNTAAYVGECLDAILGQSTSVTLRCSASTTARATMLEAFWTDMPIRMGGSRSSTRKTGDSRSTQQRPRLNFMGGGYVRRFR